MNIELEILTALKEIRDSFPDDLKSQIERCKIMRHNQKVK